MIKHLFVASVVDRVRQRPLDRLGDDLLNLLGNDRSVTTVLGVGLAGALVGLATGGVDLSCYQCLSTFIIRARDSVRCREEPPQGRWGRPPGSCRGRQSRPVRGTCPGRTRLMKPF
jgi:hypothetical protein